MKPLKRRQGPPRTDSIEGLQDLTLEVLGAARPPVRMRTADPVGNPILVDAEMYSGIRDVFRDSSILAVLK